MGDRDAQFFIQFANEAGFRRLAGLDLAAWKLPKARQLLALRALADQHPAIGIDQGGGRDKQQAGL